MSQKDIIEGRNLSVTCQTTPGNPSSTTIYWTKDFEGFRQKGPTLQLPNIQRTSSGTYTCTAENNYSNGEKGIHRETIDINVLCKLRFFLNTMFVYHILSHLKWTFKFLITFCPSLVCLPFRLSLRPPSIYLSVNFSHCLLLLKNNWAIFNQTSYKSFLWEGDLKLLIKGLNVFKREIITKQ